jgi:PhnB protein
MHIHPYLSFNGNCEEAFTAYAHCLGGEVGELFRYGGSPMAGDVPADWQSRIMHGSVKFGSHTLMGADMTVPQYEAPRGFSISLHLADVAEAERIYGELSAGGTIQMPLAPTFWAARFGAFVDRFGIPWTINCESGVQSP